jgi:hypothetical protein
MPGSSLRLAQRDKASLARRPSRTLHPSNPATFVLSGHNLTTLYSRHNEYFILSTGEVLSQDRNVEQHEFHAREK